MLNFDNFLLTESPMMIGDTEFNLNDSKINTRCASNYMKRSNKEIYSEDANHSFFRVGDNIRGKILFIDKRHADPKIQYFVEYVAKKIHGNGPYITQIAVWKNATSTIVPHGIAMKVFFDILLPLTGKLASDQYQTKDGERFWKQRLADASRIGHKVGLMNSCDGTYEWHTSGMFEHWIDNHQFAWGNDAKNKCYRFVIEK